MHHVMEIIRRIPGRKKVAVWNCYHESGGLTLDGDTILSAPSAIKRFERRVRNGIEVGGTLMIVATVGKVGTVYWAKLDGGRLDQMHDIPHGTKYDEKTIHGDLRVWAT